MTGRRCVVLDRDGTIIAERNYLADPEHVELIPGVTAGLRQLQKMGLLLVVVTNQSGLGRGFFTVHRLEQIHAQVRELLEAEGVLLDGIYFCPHTPEDDCQCRKPRAGLINLAAQELGFEPWACFVIGDKPCDIELGRRVGATTFLVQTGYGAQVTTHQQVGCDYLVRDVQEAAQVIERLLAANGNRRTQARFPEGPGRTP